MKAAVYYETGGPEVFRYEDVPDPVAGPGEVLIRVEAVSIEGGDTLNRLGGDLARVPHIVGYQCAGTVVAAGRRGQPPRAGDRVVTVGLDGSHAELRVGGRVVLLGHPRRLTTEDAACVPVPFGTADDCLFEFGRLQAGRDRPDPCRCQRRRHRRHPAGQAGRRPGARHRFERRPARAGWPTSALDHGIDYAATRLRRRVRELTDGTGRT